MSFIALLTDFGTRDYFVGAVKAAILSINPRAQIVDITHEIAPQDINEAGFTIFACYKNFPKGTIFLAVVDPGVGSERKAILVETEDYYFVAPDNGLLSFVFDENEKSKSSDGGFRVVELTNKKYFAEKISRTFHGRDIFAPVAAHLSNGVEPLRFGSETAKFVRFDRAGIKPVSETEIEAEIIHVDRFGNLVTNIKEQDLPPRFRLRVGKSLIERRRSYYAEAKKGEIFMIVGSAGFLEIVAFQDSAERLLGAVAGQKVLLTAGIPQ